MAPKMLEIGNSYGISTASCNLVSGSFVRATAVLLFLPLTVQKTRKEGGLNFDLSFKTMRQHYRISLVPVLVRDAGNSGIYYMFYQMLKHDFNLNITTSAALSAGISTIITQPFDVIISQRQLFNRNISFHELITSKTMFTGLGPRLIRRPISSTITWCIFEYLRDN